MRLFKYIFLLAIFTSCSSPRAVYDYDEKREFSGITTYQIYPDLVTGLNQLDDKRIINILNEKLAGKGFTTAENPQIYVNFYSTEYESESRSSVGVGVGGTGRNMGIGVSGGIPLGGPDTFLQLTIDFIDVQEDALIWQAVVDYKFDRDASPEKRERQLRTMIDKALAGYPPKK
ncbi:DUF4136 domain-containing protein [Antarcticibacterium flavum]|uniref:DUF4136 domain-containing protein n=1 Tax=Antarcticibacterium flavum TaxID=2058175 RepID=A0A5B7X1P8_9FLAO|nr:MULTISPECIES: DUF4136 domain-containing protein [Antarcticibacterium]MCM4160467.1 DUF4136 domain-containing protein [Antarcticibacterium sp. W02-3]QCY69210.1 DUF4136 domain-containing protein [Antarcticibacterium flavum]